jgi:hypothetical protein
MKPWHPETCGIYCAVMHCQDRCGALASHRYRFCANCLKLRDLKL